jgi:hypothetical protein
MPLRCATARCGTLLEGLRTFGITALPEDPMQGYTTRAVGWELVHLGEVSPVVRQSSGWRAMVGASFPASSQPPAYAITGRPTRIAARSSTGR